jgi:hypothetical protein
MPIKQCPYTTPQAKESIVNDSISKMIKMNVIEASDSDWASPIVLVRNQMDLNVSALIIENSMQSPSKIPTRRHT